MSKLIESVEGTVTMANGTQRWAARNTYEAPVFNSDGSIGCNRETRIEFLLDTAAGKGRAYRKASPKQAETFKES